MKKPQKTRKFVNKKIYRRKVMDPVSHPIGIVSATYFSKLFFFKWNTNTMESSFSTKKKTIKNNKFHLR